MTNQEMVDYIFQYYNNVKSSPQEKLFSFIEKNRLYKSPLEIELSITNLCNQNCKHCSNSGSGTHAHHLKPSDIYNILTFEPIQIILTGGEPFLNPYIYDIIKEIKKQGIFLKICTNGTLLSESSCNRLTKSGFDKYDTIQISLDAASYNTYNLIRESNQFNVVLSNIKNFKKNCNSNLEVHFVPMIHNLTEIHSVLNFCISNNVDIFSTAPLAFLGRANKNLAILSDDLIKYEYTLIESTINQNIEYQGPLFEWCSIAHLINPPIVFSNKPSLYYCSAGKKSLYIESNGNVYPCVFLKHNDFYLGSIYKNDFQDIITYSNTIFDNGISYRKTNCDTCKMLGICNGGCIGVSYHKKNKLIPGLDDRCYKNYNIVGE